MHAAFQRKTGTLITILDLDHLVSGDTRVFYFVGGIEGLVQSNYAVEYEANVQDVVNDLANTLPKICGHYAGISVRDGVFECAASDISAHEELYYTTTPSELIVSTDFFELAKARGQLEYDEPSYSTLLRADIATTKARQLSEKFAGCHLVNGCSAMAREFFRLKII